MKNVSLLSLSLLWLCSNLSLAAMNISGVVTDANTDEPLIGVSVLVKGTTTGTITDIDGRYALEVPDEYNTLIYSFVGYQTQEVEIDGRTEINIDLVSGLELEEVVVTALGISKEKKSLGYSAEQVSSEELTRTGERSALNALQGKVSGIQVSSGGGDPGSATRVLIRGTSTFRDDNEPLYIIDGVPVTNNTLNSNTEDVAGQSLTSSDALNNNFDFGNGINALNPEDIESISVLKGAAAAALYGIRAANGAIVITTKKGRGGIQKGLGITVNTGTSFSYVLRLPEFQNTFGQGFSGATDLTENTSWGPVMDGEVRLWGNVVNNSQLLKPYTALENNVRDFFETGITTNNSVSFSGGSEDFTYYSSFGNVHDDGIMPGDNDEYDRNTLSLRSTYKKGIMTTSGSITYSNVRASAVPGGQGTTVINNLLQIPRDISIVDMQDYETNPFYSIDNYFTPYGVTNPYFTLNEDGNDYRMNKIIGSAEVGFDATSWLNLLYRFGVDVAGERLKSWQAIAIPEGANSGSFSNPGSVSEVSTNYRQINHDVIASYDFQPHDQIGISGLVGFNVNDRRRDRLTERVVGLDLPGFYNLSNSASTPVVSTFLAQERLIGVYGEVGLSFRSLLYLTYNLRNDWSSTLPEENRSFFYQAASASFVFSELIPAAQDVLSLGKVRLSYGTVGNDAGPYNIEAVFPSGNIDQPFRDLIFPLGGVNGFEKGNRLPNLSLQPEFTKEFEIGLELMFLNDRIGVEASYYDRRTTEQIFTVLLPPEIGFTNQVLNLGEIQNNGVELLANFGLVKRGDIRWNVGMNFTKNHNEVLSLPEGLDRVDLGGLSTVSFVAEVGKPFGLFEGSVPKTSPDGSIVVDAQGVPVSAPDKQIYGDAQYDYTIGFGTDFSWKGLRFNILFDARQGGLMFSRTADVTLFAGTAVHTLYNDRKPFIVPNSVQEIDNGDGTFSYVENTTEVSTANVLRYWNAASIQEPLSVINKSFIKLREISLSYSIPAKALDGLPITDVTFNIYGRNLVVWTPVENTWIDPEVTSFGTGIEAEYGEFSANPTRRTFGVGARLSF